MVLKDMRDYRTDVSMRVQKLLHQHGVTTVHQLCMKSADELMAIKGFGLTGLGTLNDWLSRHGLVLKPNFAPSVADMLPSVEAIHAELLTTIARADTLRKLLRVAQKFNRINGNGACADDPLQPVS